VKTLLNDKTILITGGTGSFGKKCAKIILNSASSRTLSFSVAPNLDNSRWLNSFSTMNIPACDASLVLFEKKSVYTALSNADCVSAYNPFEALAIAIYT
jgi:UDP-N-acetylglucosamine 4,6-dehydratase/5-epimerase